MRKLKLDVDTLEVQSFHVASPAAEDGTVQGRMMDDTAPTDLSCMGCAAGNTWTCVGPTACCPVTWQQTCNASCYFSECGWYCHTVMAPTCAQSCQTCPGVVTCDEYPATCWSI